MLVKEVVYAQCDGKDCKSESIHVPGSQAQTEAKARTFLRSRGWIYTNGGYDLCKVCAKKHLDHANGRGVNT